jgi:hypothetical protein
MGYPSMMRAAADSGATAERRNGAAFRNRSLRRL